MNISVRKRVIYALFIAITNFIGFVIGFVFLPKDIESIYLPDNYILIYFVSVILTQVCSILYIFSLRCPNCGNRIFKRRIKIFGNNFIYFGGINLPTYCNQCNYKLGE
jgi:hypothetical protein